VRTSEQDINAAATTFRLLWKLGRDLDLATLTEYEAYFAERNRLYESPRSVGVDGPRRH
jgi:hypothetical protein